MFKYYKDIPTTNHVWFDLLDKKDKLVESFPDRICFAPIAHGFNQNAAKIHVYHDKDKVPYNLACVTRWINDINEMGFPCSFAEQGSPAVKQVQYCHETVANGLEDMALDMLRHGIREQSGDRYNFFIDLKDYEDKNHLFSTLSLIRCLTESGICRVPEYYFKLMDEKPDRDKLEACQLAHKEATKPVDYNARRYDPGAYANKGHMVTYHGNGDNVTKDKLLERFKKTKVDLRDPGMLSINPKWNGTNKD